MNDKAKQHVLSALIIVLLLLGDMIMNNGVEELDVMTIPTKIQYKNIVWTPKDTRKDETVSLSSEKIRCWLRFKNKERFKVDDLREAFPEWSRYAVSQLLYKINPLIKNKVVLQMPGNEFKVLG